MSMLATTDDEVTLHVGHPPASRLPRRRGRQRATCATPRGSAKGEDLTTASGEAILCAHHMPFVHRLPAAAGRPDQRHGTVWKEWIRPPLHVNHHRRHLATLRPQTPRCGATNTMRLSRREVDSSTVSRETSQDSPRGSTCIHSQTESANVTNAMQERVGEWCRIMASRTTMQGGRTDVLPRLERRRSHRHRLAPSCKHAMTQAETPMSPEQHTCQ